MAKLPKALSVGEETFALHCEVERLKPEREYPFAGVMGRKWRFDFCWPKHFLAVEVDGGTKHGKGRHSHGNGYEGDCEKINAATILGWKVLRFTTQMVKDGRAIDYVKSVLEGFEQ